MAPVRRTADDYRRAYVEAWRRARRDHTADLPDPDGAAVQVMAAVHVGHVEGLALRADLTVAGRVAAEAACARGFARAWQDITTLRLGAARAVRVDRPELATVEDTDAEMLALGERLTAFDVGGDPPDAASEDSYRRAVTGDTEADPRAAAIRRALLHTDDTEGGARRG